MKFFVVLYRNADGKHALTSPVQADSAESVKMTDFVRANLIKIYEVPNPYVKA